jgi:pimeloyl-ACP methyl ester carboxylesterase
MSYATTDDGVRLYYEETGSGRLVIFVHEFAGDHRGWEPAASTLRQALSRTCIQRSRVSSLGRSRPTERLLASTCS